MSDVDLSWMNVPGPDGLTWAQKYAGGQPDLSWMNTPGADGLSFVEKYNRQLLPGQANTPAPAPTQTLSPEQQTAWYQMQNILRYFGIEGLTDRLKQYIIENGTEDQTRLRLFLMEQPEFKARFPALETLRNKQRAISPEQYIELEKSYLGIMRSAGLTQEFFDNPNDFNDLIANEVTPDEFRTRIQDGYNRVANTSPLVRQAFRNYFGIQGDQALASFFIDPEKSAPALLKAAAAAEIGAAAYAQDMEIDVNYATKLAEQGVTYQQALEGMRRITQLSGLFEAGVGEVQIQGTGSTSTIYNELGNKSVSNLGLPYQTGDSQTTPSTTPSGGPVRQGISSDETVMTNEEKLGVDYVFGTNAETQRELALRLKQRRAQASGISQQTVINKRGQSAVGAAD